MHVVRSAVRLFMVAAFAVVAAMSPLAAGSARADELSDLKGKLGVVDPAKAEALLAEGRAREDKIRSLLPQLRRAEEEFVTGRQAQIKLERRFERLLSQTRSTEDAWRAQRKRADAQIEKIYDNKKLTQEERWKEIQRLRDVHRQAIRPALDRIKTLEKRGADLREELTRHGWTTSEKELDYLRLRERTGLSTWKWRPFRHEERVDHIIFPGESREMPAYTSPKPLAEELDDIVKRNKRLEAVARIGHLLSDEGRASEETAPKSGEELQRRPAAEPKKAPDKAEPGTVKEAEPETKRGEGPEEKAAEKPAPNPGELAQDASKAIERTQLAEARRLSEKLIKAVGEDDPRAQGVLTKLKATTEREADVGLNIADARRYYREGRAFDAELQETKAADSYRVALSLLAQARARTGSRARAADIDTALDNVAKRLADLPEYARNKEDKDPQVGLREAGNRECASKFPNSVMTKPDPRGGFFCRCPSGYAWNDGRTACEKAPNARARARAICRKTYSHSVFVGFKNGMPRCACPKGRIWNQSRTACVRAPRRQQARRPDPRAAQAMYALGVLIGQAIRSGGQSRSHCHREPNGSWHCR